MNREPIRFILTFEDGVAIIEADVERENDKYVFRLSSDEEERFMPKEIFFNNDFEAEDSSHQKYMDTIKTSLAKNLLKTLD